jgi:hypothetical protein
MIPGGTRRIIHRDQATKERIPFTQTGTATVTATSSLPCNGANLDSSDRLSAEVTVRLQQEDK